MVTITVHNLLTLKEKTIGLLGSTKAHPVLFHTRFGIHTLGMKYPIDVVILDKDATIKNMRENLHPNKLFFWNPLYDTVLELPNGMTAELGLHIGMQLSLRSL